MPPDQTDQGAGDDVQAVGPVLSACRLTDAIVAAIEKENVGVRIMDRGAYVRILVPGHCRVTRAAVEAALDQPFRLPGDLERVMPSFRGRFEVNADQAVWWAGTRRR